MIPSNVGYGTVTGQLIDSNGDPIAGTVTFTPRPSRLLNTAAKVTILSKPVAVTLDEQGAFTVSLVATDDTDLNPAEWTYQVSFRLTGVSLAGFDVSVPEGETVDITTKMPVVASSGTPTVVGPAPVISIGTVTEGEIASATMTGEPPDLKLNLTLPVGPVPSWEQIAPPFVAAGDTAAAARAEIAAAGTGPNSWGGEQAFNGGASLGGPLTIATATVTESTTTSNSTPQLLVLSPPENTDLTVTLHDNASPGLVISVKLYPSYENDLLGTIAVVCSGGFDGMFTTNTLTAKGNGATFVAAATPGIWHPIAWF